MTRRYGDPVAVRPAEGASGAGPGSAGFRPGVFLWRGRVYVVREVLGHWRERRAWWTGPAAQALHGDADGAGGARSAGGAGGSAGGSTGGDSGGDSTATATLEVEREIWRVEASRGRVFGTGVFDLCREVPRGVDEWRLLHVSD